MTERKTVLIIDDDDEWLNILTRLFEDEEWIVTSALSFLEAEKLSGYFDLVVTDGLNGDWRKVVVKYGKDAILLSNDLTFMNEAKTQGVKFIEKTNLNEVKNLPLSHNINS